MDPLEAILAWHLGSSTSTTLTSQEVSDTIVSEVTSFSGEQVSERAKSIRGDAFADTVYSSTKENFEGGRS